MESHLYSWEQGHKHMERARDSLPIDRQVQRASEHLAFRFHDDSAQWWSLFPWLLGQATAKLVA